MASVKYTQLPAADSEESLAFDFSSVFTFEERGNTEWKYKSAFTYGNPGSGSKSNGKEVPQISEDKYVRFLVTFGFFVIYIFTFPIMVWFSFKNIPHNERLVVFRLGRLHKLKGPGIVFLLPLLDRYHKIDVRLKAFSVPPKQVIIGDGAIIEVGAEIYFQIVDAEKSVTNVQNLDQSTRILVQTALCNILVQKSLADIEAERRVIAETVLVNSNKTCMNWGVEITRAELSQIKVLSEPPQKKPPTFVKPPGLYGTQGTGMMAGFAQLAAALGTSQGPEQTEAITHALHSIAAGDLDTKTKNAGAFAPGSEKASTTDLEAFLKSEKQDSSYHLAHSPSEIATAASASLYPNMPHSSAGSLTTPIGQLKPEDIVNMIRGALCESVVQKILESYQFEIYGVGAGTYYLDLKQGAGAIGQGPDPSGDPAATLSLTFDDLQAMLMGQLKPFQAYMSGRLKVSGDTAAALKLEELGHRIQLLMPAQERE